MSSVLTLYRSRSRARTRAPSRSALSARGLAPALMLRFPARVAVTSRTAASSTCGAIGTCTAIPRILRISSRDATVLAAGGASAVVRSIISRSSSDGGISTRSLNANLSSAASGSGYVPSCSMGFCVAITKNGSSSRIVRPPALTECSSIASSSADCVRGVARLISSARRRCVKIGPGANSIVRRPSAAWLIMLVPVMSAGIRSGVNWTRRNLRSQARASASSIIVLPSPGTPSTRTLPPITSAVSVCSMTSSYPTITLPISDVMRRNVSRNSAAAACTSFAGSVTSGSLPEKNARPTILPREGRAPKAQIRAPSLTESNVPGVGRFGRFPAPGPLWGPGRLVF